MLNDPLANTLSNILNAEKVAKTTCTFSPSSIIIKKILTMMKDNHYIGEFKEIDDGKGKIITINLLGNVNKCGVIKPRFNVKIKDYEKFEKRYLPAKDFGIIIVSTPKGLMTHIEAKKKRLGGVLIAYCY